MQRCALLLVLLASTAFASLRTSVPQLSSELSFAPTCVAGGSSAEYLAQGSDYAISIENGTATLSLKDRAPVSLRLIGARKPAATPLQRTSETINYIYGNDPRRWAVGLPTFKRVQYSSVYDGIDLVYYGNDKRLEFDLVLAPNADPRQIAFSVTGADSLRLSDKGELLASVGGREVRWLAPITYQVVNGRRAPVASQYVLRRDNSVAFEVGAYDRSRQLVIDPSVVYTTYLGGSSADDAYGVANDSNGNAYVTGTTLSTNFPGRSKSSTTENAVFVTKFSADGQRIWTTLLDGSGVDIGRDITVDSSGVFVAGETHSSDFPRTTALSGTITKNGGYSARAFVTKLSLASGAVQFSSILAGSSDDFAVRVRTTGGNVYVAGQTSSANFPTTAGAWDTTVGFVDGFVAKLDSTGSQLLYGTYIGSADIDEVNGLAVNSLGEAIVTGSAGPGFGWTDGNTNAGGFVLKINASGSSALFAKHLLDSAGHSRIGRAVTIGPKSDIYLAASSAPGFDSAARLFKLTKDTGTKIWDKPIAIHSVIAPDATDIVTSPSDRTFVAGYMPYDCGWPCSDQTVYVSEFRADGTLWLFVSLARTPTTGKADVAFDPFGTLHLVGHTSNVLFTTGDAPQKTYGGGTSDAFYVKMSDGACEVPEYPLSINICSPKAESTVQSPVRVRATAPRGTDAMRIYVDGVSRASAPGFSIDSTISMSPGRRRISVKAWDAGTSFLRYMYVNVAASECAWIAGQSITLCSPTQDSTVSSPFTVKAELDRSVEWASQVIYLDGVNVWRGKTYSIRVPLSAATGRHRVTVKAFRFDGTSTSKTVYFNVQ